MAKKINNVCFDDCHKQGKCQCRECVLMHQSKEKPATDKNDTANPNIEE